ncbi:MAG: hypothetical protein ONB44_24275 [candidate division KSB1 bacterium]|nr:hypothetical protein [candidate division KSB1 bacterium]MDZ7305252.1 hypothetical protein [candidate division KSB1 bacterium]MDZ7314378.1 hypothetical protein [candidate division KSB1 bacterium]
MPKTPQPHVAANNSSNQAEAHSTPNTPPSLMEKMRALRHRMPLFVRLPLAMVFFTVGFLGGFIPILQGWVFILAGCWLIFPDHSERILERIRMKFQKKKT